MKKNYILFILTLVFVSKVNAQTNGTEEPSVYGFYTYFNSLQNLSTPSELVKTGDTTYESGGVQLTPASGSKFGGLFINGRTITSVNGLNVEFEYEMSGGTQYDGINGDGLSFFLYDGAITTPSIGSKGAGLGYAYNRANSDHTGARAAGLTGAYLGVGLDMFGNFKGRRFQGEARVNGIADKTYSISTSHITLRGAKGSVINASIGLGNGYTGYPVLVTRTTNSNNTNSGYTLNSNGNYDVLTNTLTSIFSLRNNSGEYRKVYLSLIPNFTSTTSTDGFYVSVGIKNNSTGNVINVINNYLYKSSTKYYENAMPNPSDTSNTNSDAPASAQIQTLNSSVPATLKLGFAASTGNASQKHLIKNVKLTLPYSAESNNDIASYCYNNPVKINVLNNDIAYSGVISNTTPPTANKSYIDPATFSFEKTSYVPGNYDYTIYRTKTTAQGTWSFDQTTGLVTFMPATGFTGTATMTYSVKGYTKKDTSNQITEPYGDTAYRSIPATITVSYTGTCSVRSNIMVNHRMN